MYELVIGLLGSTLVAAAVGAIHLNSKTDVQEQRHLDLVTLINTQFEHLDTRLERLERKVLNGDYKKIGG